MTVSNRQSLENIMTDLKESLIRGQLSDFGLRWMRSISWNDGAAVLLGEALRRSEGVLAEGGALSVTTGTHTGRSPKDKFIVHNKASADSVWWDATPALRQSQFDVLKQDMLAHARLKSIFVQDLHAGADQNHCMPTRVITEFAWQALFIRNLLIVPQSQTGFAPALTILCLPSFKADPSRHGTRSETVIAFDLAQGLVLIAGTHYAGEIKKSVFTVMNHMLPARGVLPMHCSANTGSDGRTAIFFGLSGTGKTTLSTDPDRALIGDDEHGWTDEGVFNIEGGCYAKAINLTAATEPEIYQAAHRHGSVLENVVVDDAHRPNFFDTSLTENTRLAYPLDAIEGAVASGKGNIPSAIIMLTADAFGVLPPIALLDADQAMQHFMAGYTAKVAGTERGVKEPQATFSACFGQPFLTRHPAEYGALLKSKIEQHKVPCYLINTGWTGGGYGVGSRFPLSVTRTIVKAALSGELQNAPTRLDSHFGLRVPTQILGVPDSMLDPQAAWSDDSAYEQAAQRLVGLFSENEKKFKAASPQKRVAAE
jgi:phosphoenolpyruvate carboxykinase (ATP)